MKVSGFKKWMAVHMIALGTAVLVPGMALAADKGPIEDVKEKVMNQLSDKSDKAVQSGQSQNSLTVDAPETIRLNEKQEAEVQINLKGSKDKIKELIDSGDIEAALPDGLILVQSGASSLSETNGENGVAIYKGFKIVQKDDQTCQLSLNVKADAKYRQSHQEVKLDQVIQGLQIKVNNKNNHDAELLSKQFKVVPYGLLKFDVKERYQLEYKKDYIVLDLDLTVSGKEGDWPESLTLANPLPSGAEFVKISVSDAGVYEQGKLMWRYKAKQGEQEHKFHYQVKLKRDYDVRLLAQWNRHVQVKLAGGWIDWESKQEGNAQLREQLSIGDEKPTVSGGNLYLQYSLENKDDAEHKVNVALTGLEKWDLAFYMDVDRDGKITDKDTKLSGELSLKAHEKARIVVVCKPKLAVQAPFDVHVSAAVAGNSSIQYSLDSSVNTQLVQQLQHADESQDQGSSQAMKANDDSAAGAKPGDVKANDAKSQFGLTQLPKTGSDVPNSLWYWCGALLLALGAALQWKKSAQK